MADAPAGAIAATSQADAQALQSAFGIKTIRDLADNKYVQIAQAVVKLSK